MVDNLVTALERLCVDSAVLEDDWIDHILDEPRPRKRIKQDPEEIKRELEKKYLTPSRSFSTEWLNKLQQ
jgi:antiviral helicase SKI2